MTAFGEIADGLSAFYACAYLLRRWSVARGVLVMNVHRSDETPIPLTAGWIGIPPGAPWLSWFGPPYVPLVDGLITSGRTATRTGILHRRAHHLVGTDDSAEHPLALPDELLAQRRDPRFWAVAPSVPAQLIPDLDSGRAG